MNLARIWGMTRTPKMEGGTRIGKVWGQPNIGKPAGVKTKKCEN
jgi:hypothetical protein